MKTSKSPNPAVTTKPSAMPLTAREPLSVRRSSMLDRVIAWFKTRVMHKQPSFPKTPKTLVIPPAGGTQKNFPPEGK